MILVAMPKNVFEENQRHSECASRVILYSQAEKSQSAAMCFYKNNKPW